MKTIELSDEFPSVKELLDMADIDNIIIRLSNGQEFLIAEIDNFDREIELTRQNKELMAFLDERGKETKTFTLEQVRKKLGLNDNNL